MFEQEKKRYDFLAALKNGRISANVLQKAQAEATAFGQCNLDDLIWMLNHPTNAIRAFGLACVKANKDPERDAKISALLERERRPEVIDVYRAIVGAGGGKAVDVAGSLGKMVNAKDANLRRRAMELLMSKQNWVKMRNQVAVLLMDPDPSIMETVAEKVAELAPRAYASYFRKLAYVEHANTRTIALKALIQMNQLENAAIYLDRLPFESGDVKKAVFDGIVALIRSHPQEMTNALVKALGSPQKEVVAGAMDFYVKLPDKRVAFRAFLRFSDSVNAMIREQVFEQCLNHADLFADLVLDLIKTEKDPAMRHLAIGLAKVLKHQKLAPIFLHELKNPDWLVRHTAMKILGEMKSQQALNPIVEALGNPQSSIAAIQALDNYKDVRLAKPFLQKLQSGNEEEQIAVLGALKNINDERLLAPILNFLDSTAPKGKAKKETAEVLIAMCGALNKQVPPKVKELHDQLNNEKLNALPDLGLKMADG